MEQVRMNSIVLELQRDALENQTPVANLLRKALVVARKLRVSNIEGWIHSELDGYTEPSAVPQYRELRGRVQCFNPYRGWVSVVFEDPKEAELLSSFRCTQALPELETMLSGDGSLQVPFPPELEKHLMKGMSVRLQPTLRIDQTALARILSSVRNAVLNWALQLEEQGILGEGLSFSVGEVSAAASAAYNVNNFFGQVGSTNIQQGAQHGTTQVSVRTDIDFARAADFVATLMRDLENLEVTSDQKSELRAESQTIDAQTRSPKPKSTIVRESLRTIRTILEGAASGGGAALLAKVIELLL
jgi:AbiTii